MSPAEKILYTAKVSAYGGRAGFARSSDGRLDLSLAAPAQPTPGPGTNPEQLFAAGWSAGFHGATLLAAKKLNLVLPDVFTVDTEIDLILNHDGFCLRARLSVTLPGMDRQLARTVIDAAHQTCPYSKATRGNIEVSIALASTHTRS